MPRKKKEQSSEDNLWRLAAKARVKRRKRRLYEKREIESLAYEEIYATWKCYESSERFLTTALKGVHLAELLMDIHESDLAEIVLDQTKDMVSRIVEKDVQWQELQQVMNGYFEIGRYEKCIALGGELLDDLEKYKPNWTYEQDMMFRAWDDHRSFELSFENGQVVARSFPDPKLSKEQEQWCESQQLHGHTRIIIPLIKDQLLKAEEKVKARENLRQIVEKLLNDKPV